MAADAERAPLGRFLISLWRLSRPEAWMVSVLPMYVGWVLASREIVPGVHLWTNFWALAASQGTTAAYFAQTLGGWVWEARLLIGAAVALGPLSWAATLLINDVHDLPGDRLNPRKARSPLVRGDVSKRAAHAAAYVSAALALGVAWLVGPVFATLTLAALALAWAYSAPPLRFKTRPGADVAVNAVGVGVLAALAGWSIARPVAEFPFVFLPQGLLVAVAVYVPTTLVDHEADAQSGYATLATHLGRDNAYRIGWWSWIASNAGALVLAWNDWVLPRRMLPILVIFVPLLVWEYHRFIGRARDGPAMVEGIVLTSLTFLCVNLVFALMYTGLWVG